MKFTRLLLYSLVLFVAPAVAAERCFLAKEGGTILVSEGDCTARWAPESTFKIALSLMGFDSGILQNRENPSWPCPEGCDYYISVCQGDHTPRTWMRDSCIWYSRLLTGQLGMEALQSYIEAFNYGNMDLSGDKGQSNGLTHAWLSSSLQISPQEQVEFLQNIIEQRLPVSDTSYAMTKEIMYIQELPGGWKLYGKTGNGRQLDPKGEKTKLQHGWFVGYIEKGSRSIAFACHLADDKKKDTFASFRARNAALIKLWYLINDLEK
jgi:beta-lactamase class D OXA-29